MKKLLKNFDENWNLMEVTTLDENLSYVRSRDQIEIKDGKVKTVHLVYDLVPPDSVIEDLKNLIHKWHSENHEYAAGFLEEQLSDMGYCERFADNNSHLETRIHNLLDCTFWLILMK